MIYSSQLVSEFEIHITEARESACNCKQLQQKSVSSAAMFGHQQGRSPNVGVDSGILTAERLEVASHEVLICRDFVKAGALKGLTPADVVQDCDITFCCVSNSLAAKEMVFGNCGVLQGISDNKGYVEMTSIDPETSQDISEAILLRGGRYLEAPVSGSKKPAEEGTLIILAAGNRSLFNDCASCFEAIGRHAFYLGEVGNGCKMSLILSMLLGTTLAGLAEAMALCDRAELSQKDLLEILELGDLNSQLVSQKGQAIIEGTFATSMPLQHLQKDLCLAISIGDQLEQPLPVTAAANEVGTRCCRSLVAAAVAEDTVHHMHWAFVLWQGFTNGSMCFSTAASVRGAYECLPLPLAH
ncbi:hypothetical protein HPB48_018431 [Haemaphysalis longicornis]|uniref:Uncharacterized protein n=1 Tax=Haemaphysalis longicornis TaxID=44386 RepID=A0A9J6GDB6_HAELO|nr:hypothetical protein HPB48_018431 [Haemaphysalis longicornis]